MSTSLTARPFSYVKGTLWAIVGVFLVVTAVRFVKGLGATTALTDASPWGVWIAFDVMAGVALAAGGFVTAAGVYIFGAEKYHRFARPAILTALLGYACVAVGLLYDLGIPWHIWHPLIHQQYHSVLFEVAMCVMLYLTVLFLEFAPVFLEHRWFQHWTFQLVHGIIKKLHIPLVIAGIVLSTLHQSSLGSLFLIQPFRSHPLWYSPIVYVLFFTSAIGLGLMMVMLESMLSSWYFGHKIRTDLLSGLARVASAVLSLYVIVRIGDLYYRGVIGQAFDGSWQSDLFIFEMMLSAIVPASLLASRRVRTSVVGLSICSVMTVLGVMGYRFNLCIVTFQRPEGMPYFPAWTEIAVSAGIVSGAILIFIFFVQNLNVAGNEDEGLDEASDRPGERHTAEAAADAPAEPGFVRVPSHDGADVRFPCPHQHLLEAPRRYSLIAACAAAVAFGVLPEDSVVGPSPRRSPVAAARTTRAMAIPRGDVSHRHVYRLTASPDDVPTTTKPVAATLMLIDGNRNWRLVTFPHERHVEDMGGESSCGQCHHQNKPFDQNTACSDCHRDMYEVTDTFNHDFHIQKLDTNKGCVRCHQKRSERNTRAGAVRCLECHGDMVVKSALVTPVKEGLGGFAPGYMDAMHGLCIPCHEQKAKEDPKKYGPDFSRCDACHIDVWREERRLMAPYVLMPKGYAKP